MLLPGGRIDMTGRAQGTWTEFPEAALIRHEEEKKDCSQAGFRSLF